MVFKGAQKEFSFYPVYDKTTKNTMVVVAKMGQFPAGTAH